MHLLIKRRRPGTAEELARVVGISRGAFYRNLELLRGMGAEIRSVGGRGGYEYCNNFHFEYGVKGS